MSEFGLSKCKPDHSYERSILSNIRKGYKDYIIDKTWLNDIVKLFNPNEILEVRDCKNGYYCLSLTTYIESQRHYKVWCEKLHYEPKNTVYLRKFVKEVRVIWITN
jgi:hypothetical protein